MPAPLNALLALPRHAGDDLLALWREAPAPRRALYAAGGLLVASGGFHTAVLAVRGGGWQGPLSWRKPILFGFSGGVTALSVAWAAGLVADARPGSPGWRRAEAAFNWIFAPAIVAEVALISAQTWRGVPSHFNESTRLDNAIFHWIGWLISLLALQITLLGIATLCLPTRRDDRAAAAQSGLLLLILGCLLGFWTLRYGVRRTHAGQNPEVYGRRGVPKFPHGLPIHAIQYLAFQGWLMRRFEIAMPTRVRLLDASAAGNALVTGYGLVQTLAGRGRFEGTRGSFAILGAGLLLFAAPFVGCALAVVRRVAGRGLRG